MAMLKQIVVATDLSPASNAAVVVASSIAQIFKARITLLHVFEVVPQHRYRIPVEWMVSNLRQEALGKLDEVKKRLAQSGIEAEIRMLDGVPVQEIPAFLRTCESPLLLMGTHAVAGMDRFLLGSTAEQVLREVVCPVITVGPHVVSGAEDGRGLQNILFATDFSETSLAAVPFLRQVLKATGAHLRVLHISDDGVSGRDEGQLFGPVQKALQDTEGAEYITLHGSNIGQVVANEAERYPADLVVLGVRRASEAAAHLAPKLAFQIIAAAPCAVLTVSG
jgi:nucleotide-binding universal stress UspA family protein